MLEEGIPHEAEDVRSTTEVADPGPTERGDVVEPEPVEEVEVTEESLPGDDPPAQVLVSQSLNSVREIPVDVEPVIARPLPILELTAEGTHSVEEVTADIVPTAPGSAEELKPSHEAIEREIVAFASSEPPVEPVAENSASVVPEPYALAPNLTSEEVPALEPGLVTGSQKVEVVTPALPQEHTADETQPEEVPPVVSEHIEAEQVSGALQEPEHVERPWTPSYSVSSQGGGLDNVASTEEDTIAPEPPVEVAATPPPEIVASAEVRTPRVCFHHAGLTILLPRSLMLFNQRSLLVIFRKLPHGHSHIPLPPKAPALVSNLKQFLVVMTPSRP